MGAASAYLTVILISRAVTEGFSSFGSLWALTFIVGPGLFLPLEQEVARALADRLERGIGVRPVVTKAALLGAGLAATVIVIALLFRSVIVDHLFHGDGVLFAALLFGIVPFYLLHLSRGVLAGHGRFPSYGLIIAIEGIIRVSLVVALLVAGVDEPGPYGFTLGGAALLALVVVAYKPGRYFSPGPMARWSELSKALGLLLIASLLTQVLAYSTLIAINLVGNTTDELRHSLDNAFFVSRIPVLMFMAVQAALLPKLARLAAAQKHAEFRLGLKRLFGVVLFLAALGTVLAFAIGVPVGKILFPDHFDISSFDLALLAAGSGGFIVAMTFAQALISLEGYLRTVIAWALGAVVLVISLIFIDTEAVTRVSLSFLLGTATAAVVMGALLAGKMREKVPIDEVELIGQIEHEPV